MTSQKLLTFLLPLRSLILMAISGGVGAAFAEDPPVEAAPSVDVPAAPADDSASLTTSGKRGRRREVKETEGTIAPGRFEAETILKSQYHLNGQQLEVDPD